MVAHTWWTMLIYEGNRKCGFVVSIVAFICLIFLDKNIEGVQSSVPTTVMSFGFPPPPRKADKIRMSGVVMGEHNEMDDKYSLGC